MLVISVTIITSVSYQTLNLISLFVFNLKIIHNKVLHCCENGKFHSKYKHINIQPNHLLVLTINKDLNVPYVMTELIMLSLFKYHYYIIILYTNILLFIRLFILIMMISLSFKVSLLNEINHAFVFGAANFRLTDLLFF